MGVFHVHALEGGVGLELIASRVEELSGLSGSDGLVDPQHYKHETHSKNHGAYKDDPIEILRHNLSPPLR